MLSKRETNFFLLKSLLFVCFGYLCFLLHKLCLYPNIIMLAWPIRSKFRKAESSDMGQEWARRTRISVTPGYCGPAYLTFCPEAEPLPRFPSAVCGWPSTSPKSQLKSNYICESFTDSVLPYCPSLLWIYTFIIVFVTLIFYLYHI